MPVTLNKNYQRAWAVDAVDLTLSVDDFMVRYMLPHLRSIHAQIEQDVMLALQAYSENAVGTPGTAITSNTALNGLVGSARQKLIEHLAPIGEKLFMATPPSMSNLGYTYTTNQFNPMSEIGDLQKRGVISGLGGFEWFETTLAPTLTGSTYGGTPVVNGANQSGTTLITNGWSSGATTLTAGTTFTIANVYDVNPETKISLGYLKQFSVVNTVSDTSGAITVTVSPEIIGPTDPRQNVSVLPTTSDAITVLGATGVNSNCGYAFTRDAIIFATADITPAGAGQMGGGVANGGADFFTASAPELDIPVYVACQYDIRSRQYLMRLDVLGGIAPLYPQLGVKAYFS